VPIWKNHLFISASSIVVYLLVGFGTWVLHIWRLWGI
jgi:hypothetical protein